MHNIVSLTTRRSLKIWGRIRVSRVVVLVDCGVTHSFISKELVEKMGPLAKDTSPYVVEVGDGHKIKSNGVCEGIKLEVQDFTIIRDFFLFGLGEVDVVLGLEWLVGLGDFTANFDKLTFTIKVGEKKQTLKGEPELTKSITLMKII
uniref:Uncharacterized protein n=1 Tax=Cajanus cajan TaxID=3821 RepID=A0A151SZG5_CAJCA|nr:hypothetical protein KK1_015634 [Cajanus cajan]